MRARVVFTVYEGEPDEKFIEGVFSTLDLAVEAIKETSGGWLAWSGPFKAESLNEWEMFGFLSDSHTLKTKFQRYTIQAFTLDKFF
jgi:hypothetical protein